MIRLSRKNRKGFTLVEVLIVVVIMGILAATVLPQFTASTGDAKEASLVTNLMTIRNQVQMYKFQHEGKLPAQGLTDATKFTDGMTKRTDLDGTVNATSGAFGPYFIGELPPNPFNGLRTVTVATTDSTADATTGWLYNSNTGTIKPNNTGNTPSGKAYSSL